MMLPSLGVRCPTLACPLRPTATRRTQGRPSPSATDRPQSHLVRPGHRLLLADVPTEMDSAAPPIAACGTGLPPRRPPAGAARRASSTPTGRSSTAHSCGPSAAGSSRLQPCRQRHETHDAGGPPRLADNRQLVLEFPRVVGQSGGRLLTWLGVDPHIGGGKRTFPRPLP
jgi:hypothetical protein